jgi:serine/threonine protein kinase
MLKSLGHQLYACGKNGMPSQIIFGGNKYRLGKILKHDFFAATALYESESKSRAAEIPNPSKIILKLNRQQHFLGLPLVWLGTLLSSHEAYILRHLRHLQGIPRFLSHYGKTGFMYEYIEGCPLDENEKLPDDFFDKLLQLLQQIHQRDIVYLDTNKRSNILLGSDKEPYLVDFQISLHIGECLLIWRWLSKYLRDTLQRADIYHLFKHKRRLCPQFLKPEEQELSRHISGLIWLHRSAATPLRNLRRSLLKFLHSKGLTVTEKNT